MTNTETHMITAYTVTTQRIMQLRSEALETSDYRMVDWCDIALAAYERADSEGHALIAPSGVQTTRSKARAVCADALNYVTGRE